MTPLLIVDVETSGTDPATDHLVEVAALLFDTEHGVPLSCMSALIAAESNGAAAINRIPEPCLRRPWLTDDVPRFFRACVPPGVEPIYVAHNAAFDRAFLPGIGERWICTLEDAEWPRADGARSLTAIALAYDVGVAHRAIEDCLTLAAILTKVHEIEGGLGDWLARAVEPRVEVVAQVSYDDRELAKRAGFGWDAGSRLWTRRVRRSVVGEYTAGLPFRTRTLVEAAQ